MQTELGLVYKLPLTRIALYITNETETNFRLIRVLISDYAFLLTGVCYYSVRPFALQNLGKLMASMAKRLI